MMNKRSASTLVAALMILSPVMISRAQSPALEAPAAVLIDDDSGVQMRAKLDRSKQVLEGLVRQDFAAIARAARELKRISEATNWPLQDDHVFEAHRSDFSKQCDELDKLARDLNHEGVQFTFLSMTATCIRCHDHVRDSGQTDRRRSNGAVRLFPARSPLRDFDYQPPQN
jgi:Tfp pilus assembly protein PilN